MSHDARLIQETDCQLWVIEERGISEIDGGFDDYKTEVLQAHSGNWTTEQDHVFLWCL